MLNKNKKILLIFSFLIISLVLIGFVSANNLTINFTSPTPIDNATLFAPITINITANETLNTCILVFDPLVWCYQETANISTVCGGLDTGGYKCVGTWYKPYTNIYDGSWSEGARSTIGNTTIFYVNYTIPSFTYDSSLWKIKYSNIQNNYSLSNGCFNRNILQFRAFSSTRTGDNWSRSTWYCWDYDFGFWSAIIGWTGWSNSNGVLVEEAMWWHIGTSATQNYTMNIINNTASYTFTPLVGNHTYYVWCNDTAGNENSTNIRHVEIMDWLEYKYGGDVSMTPIMLYMFLGCAFGFLIVAIWRKTPVIFWVVSGILILVSTVLLGQGISIESGTEINSTTIGSVTRTVETTQFAQIKNTYTNGLAIILLLVAIFLAIASFWQKEYM